jgi:integrase
VPLPPWLADDLREYLNNTHPFGNRRACKAGETHYIAHAPLFPGRRNRGAFNWAKPVVVENVYHNYFQPACKALGLGNVRWHDLRHTFATLALSAGERYIREEDTAAPNLARPVLDAATNNVVLIERKAR